MKPAVFLFCVVAVVTLTASCAQKATPETNTNDTVVSSTPPFQTKEPERYSATRTLTTVVSSGKTEVMKYWIARDGEMRREEREVNGIRSIYLYSSSTGPVAAILPNEKLFADLNNADPSFNSDEELEASPLRLLHTDPLASTYQRLGAEIINGRNTQKYRVIVNTSTNTNVSVSETLIWVDDALQMPIKSETKSPGGARAVMELSEIVLDPDPSLFRVPEGYKKITFDELGKRLKLDFKE